ncbi:MAG: ABC transporter permease [Planctomycetota bacterium]|jgi:ABC-type Na+ efflux pump permease subunit
MSKIWLVTRAEYLRSVRTKGFIIGVLLTPVLVIGFMVAGELMDKAADTDDRRFAVVDGTGQLYAYLAEEAAKRNAHGIFDRDDPEWQVRPRFVPEAWEGDPERAMLELSDRVRSGELTGFLVLGADLVAAEGEGDRTFDWHTNMPTYDDLPDWARARLASEIRRLRFEAAGLEREEVERLSFRTSLRTKGLAEVEKTTGEVQEAKETGDKTGIAAAVGLAMLMLMLVMTSTPMLLNNVVEEKVQKIVEVLVSAVTPFELMMGKLFAAVGVSMTLSIFYVSAALVILNNVDELPPEILDALTPGLFCWFVLFQLMALLIFGSIFAGLGAACSELQDAQNLMGWVMMLLFVPFLVIEPLIEDPGGTVSTVASLIPPFTPMLMLIRVAVPPGVPWWQLAASMVLTAGFIWVCIAAAAKIFRVGVLAQGQTASLRMLMRWVLSK